MVMNILCINECSFQRIKKNLLRREARGPVVFVMNPCYEINTFSCFLIV